jgi:hypothetical protein
MTENEKYFNKLLSRQCPTSVSSNGIYTFYFELHCGEVEIEAKLIKPFDKELGYSCYEVLELKDL